MKIILSALVFFIAVSAQAADLKKYDVSTRGGNTDVDYEFTLDTGEVNTLASNEMKATLLAFCTATLGPLGPVAAKYVDERATDVKAKAGPKGAWVKMTIRNGSRLHVWDVYPL